MKHIQRILFTTFITILISACGSISPTQVAAVSITPNVTPISHSITPSPTITQTPLDTFEPAQARETIQPLLKEPMNCAVPCFWGIIPGKTSLDEARVFFSRLGFTSREGQDFYSTGYKPDSGGGFAVTFHAPGAIIENIVVTPDISTPEEGSPREWIGYSPETLIKQYGSPSRVEFAVVSSPNIGINMIMYFDTSDLIVHYSGYNMTLERFCPLTAPFDHIRLWMGHNPPDTPSFETVSLEKATSLTMDQFTQLMMGDPKEACLTVKGEVFP